MDRIGYRSMFRTDDCGASIHRHEMDTRGGDFSAVGVPRVDETREVAAEALWAGAGRFVGLWGDFGEGRCRRAFDVGRRKLPVGHVTYSVEEEIEVGGLFARGGDQGAVTLSVWRRHHDQGVPGPARAALLRVAGAVESAAPM